MRQLLQWREIKVCHLMSEKEALQYCPSQLCKLCISVHIIVYLNFSFSFFFTTVTLPGTPEGVGEFFYCCLATAAAYTPVGTQQNG